MKKIFTILVLLTFTISTFAQTYKPRKAVATWSDLTPQRGDKTAFFHVGYMHEAAQANAGLGLSYMLSNRVRLAGSFALFLPKEDVSGYSINLNAQYLISIPPVEGLQLYPLVGVGMTGTDYHPDAHASHYTEGWTQLAFNAGAGADYAFMFKDQRFNILAEYRYAVQSEHSYGQIMFGLGWKLPF